MITCQWCRKRWKWDWDTDDIPGTKTLDFACLEKPDFETVLFLCSCGGSLAVVTSEEKGSGVLEYNPVRRR